MTHKKKLNNKFILLLLYCFFFHKVYHSLTAIPADLKNFTVSHSRSVNQRVHNREKLGVGLL